MFAVFDGMEIGNTTKFNLVCYDNNKNSYYSILYSKKSRRTVIRALSSLKDKNLIKRIGSDKSGYWQIQN